MLPTQKSIPFAPLVLGLSGLIPFWGLAVGLGFKTLGPLSHTQLDTALVTYAAIILSFLGGIRWGLAVAAGTRADDKVHYGMSVLPSLVAWVMLALPEPWRLLSLGLFALMLGVVDQHLVTQAIAPPWFGRLRFILSGGAGLALLVAATLF